jgi:hypothetical protein
MPRLQDPKSAIPWSQPKCCDGELNPRKLLFSSFVITL